MKSLLLSTILLSLIIPSAAFGVTLNANPRTALYDHPVHVVVNGLKPDAVVTLKLVTKDINGVSWISHATYHADLNGTLDLTKTPPLKGSYEGVDAMGLFWSMRPESGKKVEYPIPTVSGSKTGKARAAQYTLTATEHGHRIGELTLTRETIAPDVEIRHIRKTGFYANLYYPQGHAKDGQRHPAVIALGGAEGGIRAADQFGVWLSSHGFVVLSLAWYRMGSLPQNMVHVPVNVVRQGIDYLQKQPFVAPKRIGLIGASWGGILSLFAASHMPRIHAVVSWLGGPVIGEGLDRGTSPAGYKPVAKSPFLYHGKPVAFASYATLRKFMSTGNWKLIDPAFIPVWQINGPILFVTGGDDKLEYSAIQANWAMQQLKHHSRAANARILFYPNAGHLIWPGYAPTTTRADFSKYIPVGGTPNGYAHADSAVGPQVLRFLKDDLGSVSTSDQKSTDGNSKQ